MRSDTAGMMRASLRPLLWMTCGMMALTLAACAGGATRTGNRMSTQLVPMTRPSVPADPNAPADRMVGGWDEGPRFAKADGQFRLCMMSRSFDDGPMLRLSIDRDGQWRMDLVNRIWRSGSEPSQAVALRFDDGPAITLATDHDEGPLFPKGNDKGGLIDQFRHARQLHLDAARGQYDLDLSGTDQALTALTDCTKRWTQGSGTE